MTKRLDLAPGAVNWVGDPPPAKELCEHGEPPRECSDCELARLRVRVDELLDACNQKQALLNNAAEDQRGMMDLVEQARRERDDLRAQVERQRRIMDQPCNACGAPGLDPTLPARMTATEVRVRQEVMGQMADLTARLASTRGTLRALMNLLEGRYYQHSGSAYRAWMEDPDLRDQEPCAICKQLDAAERVLEEETP